MENKKNEEELFIPKTKHKGIKIFLAIILIAALIVGGYFLYKEKFCNPNRIINNLITGMENDANNSLDNFNNDKSKYKVNGIVKMDASLSDELKDLTNIIKNIDLQFDGEFDIMNNISNITLNTKYKNEQLTNIKMYYDDNLYLLLDGIYDKYLKISADQINNNQNLEMPQIDISTKDIKTIVNSFMKASKNALNKLEFKRESTVIKIDDKQQSVYNNYIELKNTEIKTLVKDIINYLLNDEEYNTTIKKLTNKDIKNELNDLIKNIDNIEIPGTYKLNFYTDKSLLNQKLVSIRLEIANDGITSTYNYDKINDDELMFLINDGGTIISSRIKKTDSIFNFNMNITALGMKAKIDINTNFEKIKEVTKIDVSKSQDITKLTQEEAKQIEGKLQNNKGMISLIQDISKITNVQQKTY